MQPTILGGVERKSFAAMDCSVAQCLEIVGEWWTMLILRDTFLGVTRFDDFQRRLGISRNILQQRLSRLVDAGILVRVPYQEHPWRYDYRLTDKGRDLWPVINAMRQWGDQYAAPEGPPLRLTHKGLRGDDRYRRWCARHAGSQLAPVTSDLCPVRAARPATSCRPGLGGGMAAPNPRPDVPPGRRRPGEAGPREPA